MFAERCREAMLSMLGEIADFERFAKTAVVVFTNRVEYYGYISLYYEEGEHGGSAGLHIRTGYPHIALWHPQYAGLEGILAHELTHVGLHHLSAPQWLEEGLAQLAERHMIAGSAFWAPPGGEIDADAAARHKHHWGKHGLEAFWRGRGFSAPGKVQELSYQLALVLVRLLIEDSKPGWFGLRRDRQRRLVAFVHAASESDCGERAAREHLGFGLGDLAATFLGAGTWAPTDTGKPVDGPSPDG